MPEHFRGFLRWSATFISVILINISSVHVCVCVKQSSKQLSVSQCIKTEAVSSSSSSGRDAMMNGFTVCEICGAVVKCLSTISFDSSAKKWNFYNM